MYILFSFLFLIMVGAQTTLLLSFETPISNNFADVYMFVPERNTLIPYRLSQSPISKTALVGSDQIAYVSLAKNAVMLAKIGTLDSNADQAIIPNIGCLNTSSCQGIGPQLGACQCQDAYNLKTAPLNNQLYYIQNAGQYSIFSWPDMGPGMLLPIPYSSQYDDCQLIVNNNTIFVFYTVPSAAGMRANVAMARITKLNTTSTLFPLLIPSGYNVALISAYTYAFYVIAPNFNNTAWDIYAYNTLLDNGKLGYYVQGIAIDILNLETRRPNNTLCTYFVMADPNNFYIILYFTVNAPVIQIVHIQVSGLAAQDWTTASTTAASQGPAIFTYSVLPTPWTPDLPISNAIKSMLVLPPGSIALASYVKVFKASIILLLFIMTINTI